VPVGATVEHGAYVAQLCKGCHGETYSGGPIPGGPPHWPPAANLTPGEGTAMKRYDTLAKFAAMLRTGKRPDGSDVDRAMPFETLRALNETDVEALYAYLGTLPPRTLGRR
jgi:cytochrome c5